MDLPALSGFRNATIALYCSSFYLAPNSSSAAGKTCDDALLLRACRPGNRARGERSFVRMWDSQASPSSAGRTFWRRTAARVALARALSGSPRLLLQIVTDRESGFPYRRDDRQSIFGNAPQEKPGLYPGHHNEKLAAICSSVYRLENGTLVKSKTTAG